MVALAFYKGRSRLFDRLVRWWTRSPYSHVELVLSVSEDGMAECASSSFLDGGVRVRWMRLDGSRWDVVELPGFDADAARVWFAEHLGEGYDVLGLLGFVWPVRHRRRRWFCSEAIVEALGAPDSWRYSPALLASAVLWIRSASPARRAPLL